MQDIDLIIKDREGIIHKVQAPTDMALNLMEVIKMHNLAPEGTLGTCGGMAMCASCQCYAVSKNIELPIKSDDEEAMLSEAFFVKENSRLSCQITITEKLNNLEIEIAPYE